MTPIVSFLVPSFNHGKYVVELLDSIKEEILNLSVPSELIIIDDCSTDDSKNIILKWVHDNSNNFPIFFSSSDINKGITSTFNSLINASHGIYCRFCGSDDILIKGSTQKMLNEFLAKEKLLCCFGDGIVIDGKGNILNNSSINFHGGDIKKLSSQNHMQAELIQNWCLAGPSFLVKKEFYKHMAYDEKSKIDDYDFYLTLLEMNEVLAFINEKLCFYRVHDSNASKTKNIRKRIENLESFLSIINRHLKKEVLNKYLTPIKYKTEAKINFLQKNIYR